ncbi:MAG: hypothetical protein ACKOD2_02585 [Ilumatobacteraceae bacterium]
MRRIMLVAALTAGLMSLPVQTSAATGVDIDEGYLYEHPNTAGWQGVLFGDKGEDQSEAVSSLWGRPDDDFGVLMCARNSDANCSSKRQVTFNAMLQPCASSVALDCIVEFGHVDQSGTRVPATYVSKFPAVALNEYSADPAAGLPAGTSAGLWRLAPGSGSAHDLHYVNPRVFGERQKGETKFTYLKFGAAGSPVILDPYACSGANCSPGFTLHPDGISSGFGYGNGRESGQDCVMTGTDPTTGTMSCATRKAFTPSVVYYLKVRLSQSPKGWMHGRLNSPKVQISPVAGSDDALTIDLQGSSVSVPVVSKGFLFKDLPAAMQEKYRPTGGWPVCCGGSGYFTSRDGPTVTTNDPDVRNRLSIPPAGGPVGLAEISAWLPLVNDTASADVSMWGLRTLQEWEMRDFSRCMSAKQRMNVIVVTNATQYSAGPPSFNASTNSLDYKVAAPHYRSGGSETKGVYELIMRTETARCVYGFEKAPFRSTIQVIESAGVQDIATTNVSERDGWIQLSAYNYTHSSPTMRVKFAQGVDAFEFVKKGKALSATALAKSARLNVRAGAKVSLRLRKGAASCAVSGSRVSARAKGYCRVAVTMRVGGKSATRVVDVTVL